MKFILFTYVSPEGTARWNQMGPDERAADIERHRDWFRRHAGAVVGGEELGERRAARVVRRGSGGLLVTDGPFAETKEWIGGFIIVDVEDAATALGMAADWPGLDYPGHAVEVMPTGHTTPEADAGGG